jgi:hypothetical protein
VVGEPENVNEAGGKVKVSDGQDMKKYNKDLTGQLRNWNL